MFAKKKYEATGSPKIIVVTTAKAANAAAQAAGFPKAPISFGPFLFGIYFDA